MSHQTPLPSATILEGTRDCRAESALASTPLVTGARRFIPYQSHFIEVAGFNMHYLDEGEGPVVLLLHGNPTWCFYYRNLIARLCGNFRVIAPDFIGCGLSDHPTDVHFRASDRIDQLQEFIDALGLDRFALVMHDWGGPIGSGLAVRNVEKVEKIVYLNTTLTETEALPGIIKLAATRYIGKFLTKYSKRFLKFTTGLGTAKKLPKEVRLGYYYPYKNAARRTAIWDFVDDIPFDNTHPSYAEMLNLGEKIGLLQDIPVKIIWGLRDPCFHREMLNKVAGRFPHAEILEIAEASHLVLEDASDIVKEAIDTFLSRKEGQRAGAPYVNGTAPRSDQVTGSFLYERFQFVARQMVDQPAVIEPLFLADTVRYSYITFQELEKRINKYQRGLAGLGLEAGDRVLMLVPAGDEFLALSYAVMARGAIPIFIDPGIGKDNLLRCVSDINPDVLIGSPKAQLLRLKKKEIFPNLKFHLTVSDWLYTGGPTLSYLKRFSSRPLPAVNAGEVVFIAFTSGATGVPKGVVFTQQMLEEQLRIFSDVVGLEPGRKDLPLLPIFSLFQLALGVCSVFPPIDSARPLSVGPDKIMKIVKDLRIDYSFGSPTLWNKIAEYCIRSGSDLAPLSKILMAGAPVSDEVRNRAERLLPAGVVYTPYGATEALPVTMVTAADIEQRSNCVARGGEQGTYVGKAVDGVRLRVIEPVEGAIENISEVTFLEPACIGEVIVSGKNVSPFYFEREEATLSAKINDGDDFWHRMGDLGYIDPQGGLYFCGRIAHAVHGAERIFYSVPIESIFNEHPKVKRSALVSLGADSVPGIAIEPYPHNWPQSRKDRENFQLELLELARESQIAREIVHVFFHPSFPVDSRHNAKIFRDRLSTWAQEELNSPEST